jgi:hypothetical protein
MRQHTSAYVSIRTDSERVREHFSVCVSIRQHTSAYVSIRTESERVREHFSERFALL